MYPNSGFSNNGPTRSGFNLNKVMGGPSDAPFSSSSQPNTPQGGYGPDYGMVGKTPGLIPPANTNVKKHTTTDAAGNTQTQEYFPPTNTESGGNTSKTSSTTGNTGNSSGGSSSTSSGSSNPTPNTPQVGTTTQNAQNVLDQSQLANNLYYQSLVKQQQGLITGQTAQSQVGVGGQNPGGQSAGFNNQYAPQTTASLQGEQGIISPQIAAQLAGTGSAESALLQAGQLGTSGAQSVLSASLPQFGVGQGLGVGQPLTGNVTNGGSGQNFGSGTSAAANAQQAQAAQSSIDANQEQAQQLQSAYNQAYSFATQAGLPNGSAMLAGIQNAVQKNVLGSTASADFSSAIANLNGIANKLGLSTVDVNTVTPEQLQSLQQAVANEIKNNNASYQAFIDQFNSSGSSSSNNSSSGSTGDNSTSSYTNGGAF